VLGNHADCEPNGSSGHLNKQIVDHDSPVAGQLSNPLPDLRHIGT
jgi:hypothetical protein